jgi:hypothetical protein
MRYSFLSRCILAAFLLSTSLITEQAEAKKGNHEQKAARAKKGHLQFQAEAKKGSHEQQAARARKGHLQFRRKSQIDDIIHFVRKGYCDHIYWDIGSNIGVQIRKLYEPHLFLNSSILPYFYQWFGRADHRKQVCSLGVEANDEHTPRLLELQSAYQKAWYPCVVLTDSVASDREGDVTFYHDTTRGPNYKQLGASITPHNITSTMNYSSSTLQDSTTEDDMSTLGVTQPTIDIDHLVHRIMDEWRKSNYKEGTSRMIAKMDIEGSEYLVLPHMAKHGSLCYFDVIMLEWHPMMQPKGATSREEVLDSVEEAVKANVGCKMQISREDDESYYSNDKRPWPEPGMRISLRRT